MLTLRGITLADKLKKEYDVIEIHPRTSQKMLGFKSLKEDLDQYFELSKNPTEHELDAAVASLIGFLYLKNCFLELGDPEEGTIIIPKDEKCLQKIPLKY